MVVTYAPQGLAVPSDCCIVNTPRRHTIGGIHGWVAQSAEQWTENPRVGGSIPPPATPFGARITMPGGRSHAIRHSSPVLGEHKRSRK